MVKAAFCIKNENEKNHINLINDFIIKNEYLDKCINEYFDKNNNQTYYLISDVELNREESEIELDNILDREEHKWFGHL
jgi:hypothetical protein